MKRSASEQPVSYGSCKSPRMCSSNSDSTDSSSNRMKVCVRVRPFTRKENENGTKSIIDIIDQNMLVFDPYIYDEANDKYEYQGKTYKEIGKRSNKNLQFIFDRVFNEDENNLTVYTETTKDLVSSLLTGYNCSVFAYGSTGSGKTHTMLGSINDPGVIFFTTMDLYKHLEDEKDRNLELSISYFEIYNEVIYDLLDPTSGQPLSVLENGNKGMTVRNLSIHQPRDADHLLEMLEFGNKNRKQHPTDANSESSRSHAIFQITLRRKDFSNEQEMSIQVSKMSLIDLAGSERASNAYKTYRSQGLHREGGNINKSLLSLGNCINALTSNKKNGYIPYRSSKLTLILRDSLGGNCQTLMVATISPSANQYEEIHNTLIYAERAKGVKLEARKNNIAVSVQPRDYKHMFEKMSQEKFRLLDTINNLKKEIEMYKNRVESIPDDPITSSADAIAKLHSVKNVLDDLFKQRIDLRRKLLDCDHNLKLLDLRLLFRNYDNQRLKLLEDLNDENQEKMLASEAKTNEGLHAIYSQKLHYSNLKSSIQKEVTENEAKIMKLDRDLLEKTNDDMVVRSYFVRNNCLAQTKDMQFSEKHHMKIIQELCSKYEANEELTSDVINFVYKSYHILNGLGQLSEDMESKFKFIVQKIKGKKNVVWRDDVDSPKLNKTKDLINLFSLPVYLSTLSTPDDKRSLVTIRDITPITLKAIQNTVDGETPQQQNAFQSNPNLGNTVTKARNVAVVSPAIDLTQSQFGQENQRLYNNYNHSNNFKTSRYFGQTSSQSRSSNSKRKRQFNYRYNNHNANFTPYSSSKGDNYNYNPNFRPRFRF